MSNQRIVSTSEISWSEITPEIKVLRCKKKHSPNDDVCFEKLKINTATQHCKFLKHPMGSGSTPSPNEN